MKIIGLTGGIASGKSTVSRTLAQMGAQIINADEISHAIIEPGAPAWEEIVSYFGRELLNPDNSINRTLLGAIVFNDPASLQELNRITHPRVMQSLRLKMDDIKRTQPDAVLVMEIPLLYETNMNKLCNEVWVVWVDRDTQLQRLMARDNIGHEDALRRIASQMPLDEKAKRADRVIDNSQGLEETIAIATRYFNEILNQNVV